MKKRIEMTVKIQVTESQALALQAFFKHWNRLASWGSSRFVAFYVDGDGDFKPKCEFEFSEPIRELTEDLEQIACIAREDATYMQDPGNVSDSVRASYAFDYNPIAWKINNDKPDPA